jgi:hypothetical protein
MDDDDQPQEPFPAFPRVNAPTLNMKSATITITLTAAFTLALAGLSAQAQTAAGTSAPQTSLSQISQWRGQYGGEEKSHTRVFPTQKSWADLWAQMGQQPPAPLDEKTQMAIFISVGERSTGGFKPYVISALEHDGKMVVSWSSGQPILTDVVVQELTRPWVAALIPKSSLPVVFKEI